MNLKEYLIIPGKFKFHDAIDIVKMLNIDNYRIPSVEEGVGLIKNNDYLLGDKTLITTEAQEFGENGNWIYVACRTTDLTESMENSDKGFEEGYIPRYKRHPRRDGLYDLILIK